MEQSLPCGVYIGNITTPAQIMDLKILNQINEPRVCENNHRLFSMYSDKINQTNYYIIMYNDSIGNLIDIINQHAPEYKDVDFKNDMMEFKKNKTFTMSMFLIDVSLFNNLPNKNDVRNVIVEILLAFENSRNNILNNFGTLIKYQKIIKNT